jgi:hypothetical protein
LSELYCPLIIPSGVPPRNSCIRLIEAFPNTPSTERVVFVGADLDEVEVFVEVEVEFPVIFAFNVVHALERFA